MLGLVFLSLMTTVPAVVSQNLLAQLSYGTFQGTYSSQYNISYWQKIPYAAPPTGQNRFRAPQPPSTVSGTYNSGVAFDHCPQNGGGSEDCLYLGLFSRPWNKGDPLRPVVMTFHGGGFVFGGGSFDPLSPPAYPILDVTKTDLLFVYPNYRLGAYGFLPGQQIADDSNSDLNPGLLDQEYALKWVQSNIAQFGGDPNNVAVWGQSAGGGSTIAQTISRAHDPPLMNKAWASSPYWPKTYNYNDPQAQSLYDQVASRTGCTGTNSLACLKALPASQLTVASDALIGTNTYTTSTYNWAPVIDGVFLTQRLSQATAPGGRVKAYAAVGWYNQHEGDGFVPPGFQSETGSDYNSSEASFEKWLAGFLPDLSSNDLAQVRQAYPPVGASDDEFYNTTYTRAGLIYRDVQFACPSYWLAAAAPSGGWLPQYTIPPAVHGSDVGWFLFYNSLQKNDPLHFNGYAGAFSSFFATSDPNARKLTPSNVPGMPPLSSGSEWLMTPDGFDTYRLNVLPSRCNMWRQLASKIPM